MKKLLFIALLMILTIGICGCGQGISSDVRDVAEDALDVMEINYDANIGDGMYGVENIQHHADVYDQLHGYASRIERMIDFPEYDPTQEFVLEDQSLDVQVYLAVQLAATYWSDDDYDNFRKQADTLRELLKK